MHARAGCRRENPTGIKPDIWQVPHAWDQMASPKRRPGLHPWHCLPCPACSSKPSERGTWDALPQRHLGGKEVFIHSQHNLYFFLPEYTFQGTTGTNVVFFPLLYKQYQRSSCMLYGRDGAMTSRSMKDTWYISVTYRSTAAPYVMGRWEDGLSPK